METSGCSNEDKLSNLPPNVLDGILMLLPIKDAVRTSILSSDWRDRWTVIPQLIFNNSCTPPPCRDPYAKHLLHVSIVDQVLLNHKGPIRNFHCSLFVESCPDIDRWIVFLSKHGIQEFILHCLDGEPYKVPSRLFSCQDLRYLELTDCIIKPPPTFSCLANLKTLVLSFIIINNEALRRLLLKCKFLENLRLTGFEGLSNLEILAPNLKRISIIGSFRSLLLDTPLLASARIDLIDSSKEKQYEVAESGVCNLIKVLGRLQHIQKLEVKNWCLQFLALGKVPRKLLTTYKHLKYLSLCVDFSNLAEIYAACCLITSAPYLENIKIRSMADELLNPHGFGWEAPGFTLNCLHSMEMTGISGGKNELDLLEFVLAKAPLLGRMTVQMRNFIDEPAFLRSLVRFRRASTQATIMCLIEDERS